MNWPKKSGGYNTNRICIYGARCYGDIIRLLLEYNNTPALYFGDRHAAELNGHRAIPVYDKYYILDDYKKNPNLRIIITSYVYKSEIMKELLELGLPSEIIFDVFTEDFFHEIKYICDEMQYFDKEILNFDENEVMIDCGAYNLETSVKFLEMVHSGKVIAIEPDPTNFKKCEEVAANFQNVTLYNCGVDYKKGKISFSSLGDEGSSISENGNAVVPVDSIDNIVGNQKITFIKMDIEGMELRALQGAENTIKNNKPKLAICIYHKDEDLFEIPQYIKKLVPEYKLYIRHYSSWSYETVLYATL